MLQVTESFHSELQNLVQNLSQNVAGVKFVVITTADGFEVAASDSTYFSKEDLARLAAMSSSISAIGSMAVKEVNVGCKYSSITIEGDDGYILIFEVPHPNASLIMSLVTSSRSLLGQVLYQAKSVVADICEIKY